MFNQILKHGYNFQVSELYPTIDYDEQIVDNTCQQLVINPQQFDVMVGSSLQNFHRDSFKRVKQSRSSILILQFLSYLIRK